MDYGKISKPGLLFGEFKVEPIHQNQDSDNVLAYQLIGKKKRYTLWRNRNNPRQMFVMGDPHCVPCKCRGYEWFYEAPCGRIIPLQ